MRGAEQYWTRREWVAAITGYVVWLGLVFAIVDRVTFNAHILETGTRCYRLRTSKTTARRKRAG